MIISGEAFVMLLMEPYFRTFTKHEPCDTARHTEGLYALSCGSRAEVDEMVNKALAAGGKPAMPSRSRLHVRPELLRPRRASLGDSLDGSEGCRVGT